jgi:hypothetical protein
MCDYENHSSTTRHTQGGPEMTTQTYDANKTALLMVDPYNDFLSEGG